MTRRVVDKLNSILGNDISNLSTVSKLHTELTQQLQDLDQRLSTANSAVPTELQSALRSCESVSEQVSELTCRQDQLLDRAGELLHDTRTFSSDNTELLGDIASVRGVVQYTVWLRLTDKINEEVEAALLEGDGRGAVAAYDRVKEVADMLDESQCANLRRYTGSLVEHWYVVLHDKFVADMETVVQSLGWPFVQGGETKGVGRVGVGDVGVDRLVELVELLLLMQRQGEDTTYTLPMKVLLKPIRKRFRFHFMGSKATNNPSKPEWYVTQLLTWLAAHAQFLLQNLQPIYDKVGLGLTAQLEFAQGLVELATEKLSLDLPLVLADDVLLAHTIDEVVGFARDLSSQVSYRSNQPSALEPLTNPNIFSRWIDMERKFAFEKVDEVMCGEGAWESDTDGIVPRAAQSFLALLLSVTDRYKFLSASHHRLDFLDLQVELLEDFRLRLVQLVRAEQETPLTSNLCPILATVDHVINVLSNWGDTPFFLQLENQKCQAAGTDMTGTVFDNTIDKLEHFKKMMINSLVESISFDVKARSRPYKKEVKWHNLPSPATAVSPGACGLLQTLAFQFESVRDRSSAEVFSRVWQEVAAQMDMFVWKEVVMTNQFSEGGVLQLVKDTRDGLFPIFGVYTTRPASLFPYTLDCFILMQMLTGSALLTLDTLSMNNDEATVNTLRDLGVKHLTRSQAVGVIQTRLDVAIH